jgi:hypothetical protein
MRGICILLITVLLIVGLAGHSFTADCEEMPPVQCSLSINSTAGGSVTIPGEGVFTYDQGQVVNLVATPDAGYRFDKWTGDIDSIAQVSATSTNITVGGNYPVTANFVAVEAGHVGIKAGDWIKLAYAITGLTPGQVYVEWLKLDFLSVNGTVANVRGTVHASDGTEASDNASIDVTSGSQFPGLAGILVSANLTTGEAVYIAGYGNVTIEGETAGAYVGANRSVVYAGFSQNETQVTYYWDKLTGVMVELSATSPGITVTAKATETNMWGAVAARMPWWPWIAGAAVLAVGLGIFFGRRGTARRAKAH